MHRFDTHKRTTMVTTRNARKNSLSEAREEEAGTKKVIPDESGLFVLDKVGDDGEEDFEERDENVAEPKEELLAVSKTAPIKTVDPPKKDRKKVEKNELTKLIPGYTAPMKLNTSSLDKYRPAGGIKELQRRAERTDASTRFFVTDATKKHTDAMQKGSNGLVNSSYVTAYSSFKTGTKRAPDPTAGKGWFGMVPTPLTDELKADLTVIRNRNYLDPKKFYKSADKFGSVLQVGTVIEGPSEYFSSRLTKKERRNNLTEEIMADPASANYARNKFKKMAQEKTIEAKKRSRSYKPKRGKRGF